MKEEILKYLAQDRTFTQGLVLLGKYLRNQQYVQLLNRKGENNETRESVYYELSKLADLSDIELRTILNTDIKEEEIVPETIEEKMEVIPEEVKKAIKLREEFPFLSAPDCPDVYKVLVSDLITSYETFKTAHPKLLDAITEEQVAQLSELIVENFIENRQIWDELNNYKEKGEILGVHPIFNEMKLLEELKALPADELSKRKGNLKSTITRTNKKIPDEKDEAKLVALKEKVASSIKEVELIESILKTR